MKNRGQTLLLIIGVSLIAIISTINWMSSTLAAGEAGNGAAILINHEAVDAAQIPQVWLDEARELDTFFAHRSVGNNILTGIGDLRTQNATRYSIAIDTAGANWFVTNNGILHQPLGTNGQPQTKIDGFDAFIRSGYHGAEVAMMKFCPSDVIPFGTMPAANIWTAYRDKLEALEQTYPEVLFVWWTIPLSTAADDRGNDQKEIFNGLMRSYCDANNCVLFDIADIESHDPDGDPVTSAAGYEAMWNGYSYDGGHLNETGRVRVAAAYWWLLARIAGWEPSPVPDFALSITPEMVDVMWGDTAVYNVSVQGTGEFNQPVQLSTNGLPPGAAVSWGANPVAPNQATTLSITIDKSVPTGNYLFDVVGTAGMLTKRATVRLRVLDPPPEQGFSLKITPELVDVLWGETAVYSITVRATGGFSQAVQLSTTGLPSGATVTWGANPLPQNRSTWMGIRVGEAVPAGDYSFNIVGTAGSLTEATTAQLRVRETSPDPRFSLSITPEMVVVLRGETAVYSVTVQGANGFSQPVELSAIGLQSEAAVSWDTNPLPPDQTTTMSVAVDETLPAGDYLFYVVGTAGSLTKAVTARLRVLDPPPEPGFSVSIAPEMVNVLWGETAVYSVTVQATGGFSQSVQLDATDLPPQAVISWGANPLPPNQTTTLSLGVDETVSTGEYSFNVVGTTDMLKEVAVAKLAVRRPLFLPLILR